MGLDFNCRLIAHAWRAHVGRLPRAVEQTLPGLVSRHGGTLVGRAVGVVAASGLRRTKDRLRLFYAYFGESVPPQETRR